MENQENQQEPTTNKTSPALWVSIILVIIVLAVGAYFLFTQDATTNTNNANATINTNIVVNENINVVSNTNTKTNINVDTNVDTSTWETYENTSLGFSFQYPSDWNLVEKKPSGDLLGLVVSIQSPEIAEGLQLGNVDPGYSQNVIISFWSSINNQVARGGSWIGLREYESLIDYLSDEQAPKKKVGEITVDGLSSYEVSIGGTGLAYGVMVESNGIYEIAFLTTWDKSQLGATEQEILSSFVFIK